MSNKNDNIPQKNLKSLSKYIDISDIELVNIIGGKLVTKIKDRQSKIIDSVNWDYVVDSLS